MAGFKTTIGKKVNFVYNNLSVTNGKIYLTVFEFKITIPNRNTEVTITPYKSSRWISVGALAIKETTL
jgi:hypothetical protein